MKLKLKLYSKEHGYIYKHTEHTKLSELFDLAEYLYDAKGLLWINYEILRGDIIDDVK